MFRPWILSYPDAVPLDTILTLFRIRRVVNIKMVGGADKHIFTVLIMFWIALLICIFFSCSETRWVQRCVVRNRHNLWINEVLKEKKWCWFRRPWMRGCVREKSHFLLSFDEEIFFHKVVLYHTVSLSRNISHGRCHRRLPVFFGLFQKGCYKTKKWGYYFNCINQILLFHSIV